MASVIIAGDTSGTITLAAPAVAGTPTLTLPTTTGTFALTSQVIASGTVMLFVQTAAPTGWTKSTTHNDKALRVISGTVSTGGSVAFTTAFASQSVAGSVATSGATTLSTSQIPNHYHQVFSAGFAGNIGVQPATSGGDGSWYGFADTGEGTHSSSPAGSDSAFYADNAIGGGSSHTHASGAFTGTAINLAVQYVDVIIATKD